MHPDIPMVAKTRGCTTRDELVEIKEVIRLWRAGIKKKRIASQLTLDVKTVRRYVSAAEDCGLVPGP